MDKVKTMTDALELCNAEIERLRNRVAILEDLNQKAFECLVKASLRADALAEELDAVKKYRRLEMLGKETE